MPRRTGLLLGLAGFLLLVAAFNIREEDPNLAWRRQWKYDIEHLATPAAVNYNPAYDLWSTGGGKTRADEPRWIKNW